MRDSSATLLKHTGEVPSPRYGHAGARIGDTLLIWGGITYVDYQQTIGLCDGSLHLLNLETREWTRVVVIGPGPVGRYYHAATVVGSKLFVFGGRYITDLNDMWALDLNSLNSNPVWESYEPASGGKKPPPRSNHVLVTTGDRIILFGGVIGGNYYNDTWSFDVSTRKWTELRCTGHTPSPRDGHAAALVDDIIYVFGGRSNKAIIDDLLAFKLSTQRWFLLQNIGPSPSGRWCHAVASDGSRVFVFGGRDLEIAREESLSIHVLDTKLIKYPKSDPNAVNPSEKTIQLSWKSSTSPPTQEEDDGGEGSAERAKLAVPDASSEGEVAQLELEQQLSATRAALTERDQRLAQLTDELREHADRLLAKTLLVEQKDAELVEMRAKLNQQVRGFEQAPQKVTSHAIDVEERSRRACERYETELAEVRAELGASKSELEAVRLRLTDAEIGWAKSKTEADTLRAVTTPGLTSTDEERITRGIVERMRAEMASMRLSEKSSEAIESRNEG